MQKNVNSRHYSWWVFGFNTIFKVLNRLISLGCLTATVFENSSPLLHGHYKMVFGNMKVKITSIKIHTQI